MGKVKQRTRDQGIALTAEEDSLSFDPVFGQTARALRINMLLAARCPPSLAPSVQYVHNTFTPRFYLWQWRHVWGSISDYSVVRRSRAFVGAITNRA